VLLRAEVAYPCQNARTQRLWLNQQPHSTNNSQQKQNVLMKPLSDIGLIGLAVMGENLVLNMASKGFTAPQKK
jgi:NAD binding domain of 6-phosphogluconate dehydrogenase